MGLCTDTYGYAYAFTSILSSIIIVVVILDIHIVHSIIVPIANYWSILLPVKEVSEHSTI